MCYSGCDGWRLVAVGVGKCIHWLGPDAKEVINTVMCCVKWRTVGEIGRDC